MFRLTRGSRAHRVALLTFALLVAVAFGSRYFTLTGGRSAEQTSTQVGRAFAPAMDSDFERAHRLLMVESYEAAIRRFRELDARSAGMCAACRNNIGFALMRLGLPGDAEVEFSAAVDLDASSQLYANNLAWARRTLRSSSQRTDGPQAGLEAHEEAP